MGRRSDTHRLIRWLWTSRRIDARLARLALLPLAALWRVALNLRNQGYDRGWLAARGLPLPAVGVGNLTVGGSGKTPLASWIAGYYAQRGLLHEKAGAREQAIADFRAALAASSKLDSTAWAHNTARTRLVALGIEVH